MKNEVKLIDNAALVIAELREKVDTALEAVGTQAESHAKSIITQEKRVDTGALRNSVSHAISGDTVYIGSNLPYAVYNELGTGIYASQGNGRQTPWAYRDRDGVWHWTRGMKPIHFLKRAIETNQSEYRAIIEQIMRK